MGQEGTPMSCHWRPAVQPLIFVALGIYGLGVWQVPGVVLVSVPEGQDSHQKEIFLWSLWGTLSTFSLCFVFLQMNDWRLL